MIKPCNYSIVDTANWVLDTGSPIHVCNSLQGLLVSRRFKDGEQFLSVRNGNHVQYWRSESCILSLSLVLSS